MHGKVTYNESNKHESNFTSVTIQKNNSVMLNSFSSSACDSKVKIPNFFVSFGPISRSIFTRSGRPTKVAFRT